MKNTYACHVDVPVRWEIGSVGSMSSERSRGAIDCRREVID
jgi:hypothetical protein